MNDCANADIRDRLPDLVSGSLAANEAALLESHVATCVDCQEELAVIRGVRTMLLVGGRAVDTSRIIEALPTAARPVVATRSWASWASWGVAAAITVVVLGGGTLGTLVARQRGSSAPVVDSTVAMTTAAAPSASTVSSPSVIDEPAQFETATASTSSSTSTPPAEMTVAASVGNLTDSQLAALISRIENVDAVPLDEPARHALPIVVLDSTITVKDLGGTR